MRAPKLTLLLVLLVTAIVVAATGAVTLSATRVLGKVADEEALSSVGLGAASVVEGLRREADALSASAQLLSERPTLRRAVDQADAVGLSRFLEGFRATSGLATCAIVRGTRLVASTGDPLPDTVLSFVPRRVRTALAIAEDGRSVRLLAFAAVPGSPDATVVATRVVDPASAGGTAARRALSMRVWARASLDRAGFGPRSPQRESALAGEPHTARVREEAMFVADAPLRSAGEIVGVVEAEMPFAEAAAERARWVREVRRLALVVLALALVGSIVLGRAIAGPIDGLTRAAAAIGRGDLDTPVPAGSGGETGVLARTMEDMRLKLVDLTAEGRRRQAETDAILAGLTAGVYAVDEDRRIRYMTPRAAAMLGTTPEQALGRFCGDVLCPRDAGGGRPCEDRCPILQARVGSTARAVEHLVPEGTDKTTVVVTSAPPSAGRQIQLLREETEAETTRRLRDAVVANISHEFKTPLAAQLASIEMLRDQLGSLAPGEARDLVLALERGGRRLTRLIDNLLESVRLDAGEDAIRRRRVAVDEVVEEGVESMRALIEQRGQRLDVDLPHPLPEIVGDAPRLTQVLVNLLANANKFAPAGTLIEVGGAVEGAGVTLWVADEGPGLPEGDDTMFERFVRTPGEEPEQSGMGLGLWIAKSIVERHGGRIWSEPRDRGAKVCVWLPEAAREDPGGR